MISMEKWAEGTEVGKEQTSEGREFPRVVWQEVLKPKGGSGSEGGVDSGSEGLAHGKFLGLGTRSDFYLSPNLGHRGKGTHSAASADVNPRLLAPDRQIYLPGISGPGVSAFKSY